MEGSPKELRGLKKILIPGIHLKDELFFLRKNTGKEMDSKEVSSVGREKH